MGASPPNLLPPPRRRHRRPGLWKAQDRIAFYCDGPQQHFTRALPALERPASPGPGQMGLGQVEFSRVGARSDAQLILTYCSGGESPSGAHPSPESYELHIAPERIELSAPHGLGLLQGTRTLKQWLASAWEGEAQAPRPLPCEVIVDSPAILRRGVMLDISRDRVPRMDFLRAWIEQLAALKINELQLYTEHAFAYDGHQTVWQGTDPITPGQLAELAHFCHERGIDLVPNQQSLGHMHRWLKHPSYHHLAECPGGIDHPFSTAREPYGLAVDCDATLPFLAELYGQLLPHCLPPVVAENAPFQNGILSVGLDEAEDLGQGRSAALEKRLGRRRLFCGHLKNVARLAVDHGRRVQFWADELLAPELPLAAAGGDDSNPGGAPGDLAADLPPGAMPLVWGYEADHPWERACTPLAGTEFYICPGTSSWNSFLGRPANARANLVTAAQEAAARGAAGYLITDWGDRGHHQPPTISDGPLALGLSLAWNTMQLPAPEDIHAYLDQQCYGARGLAAAVEACGRAAEAPAVGTANENPPSALLRYATEALPHRRLPGLAARTLERAQEQLTAARAHLEALACPTPQATLARAEVAWAARLANACLHLGLARLAQGGLPLARLAAPAHQELARHLAPCLADHGPLWRGRSREGGRADSLDRLLALCADLGPSLGEQLAGGPADPVRYS
ncbi:MAG: hypothetical protein QF724_04180 [Planctomycetota bacterium]|nr:hypothetical protein [Planctomycetota bacterium]